MPSQEGTYTVRRAGYVGCKCELTLAQWTQLFDNPTTGTGLEGIYRYAGYQVPNAGGQKPTFKLFEADVGGAARLQQRVAQDAIHNISRLPADAIPNVATNPGNVTVAFVNWDEQGMPPKPRPGKTSLIYVAAAIEGECEFVPFTGNRERQCVNLTSGYFENLP